MSGQSNQWLLIQRQKNTAAAAITFGASGVRQFTPHLGASTFTFQRLELGTKNYLIRSFVRAAWSAVSKGCAHGKCLSRAFKCDAKGSLGSIYMWKLEMNDPSHRCLYPHVSQHTLWVSVRHQWFLTKCQNGTPWEWERASLAHWDITVSILFLHVRAKRHENNTSKREAERSEMEEMSWREWSDKWEINTISASVLRVKGSKSKENGERESHYLQGMDMHH